MTTSCNLNLMSERQFSAVSSSHPNGVAYRNNEDFAIADGAGTRGLDDGADHALGVCLFDHELDLALGQHVDAVLLAAAPGMDDALLNTASRDVDDVEAHE